MREEWDVAGLTDLRNVMVRMIELATKTLEEGKLLKSDAGSRVTGCGECVEAMERIDLFVEHTLFILGIDRFHVFG